MTTSEFLDDPELRDEIPRCWLDEARKIDARFRFAEDVRPWNWLELDKAEAEKLWASLVAFVNYFNYRYGERIERRIPPCWAEHGPLVEELTTLVFARWHSFESPHASVGGAQYWHSYTLPTFFHRLREWLGDDLLSCQQGRHRNPETVPVGTFSWHARNEFIGKLDVKMRANRTNEVSYQDIGDTSAETPHTESPIDVDQGG